MKDIFKNLDKKKLFLLLGIPVIVLIIGLIILQQHENSLEYAENEIDQEQLTAENTASTIPVIGDEDWKEDVNKVEVYQSYNQTQQNEQKTQNQVVSDTDFFNVGADSPVTQDVVAEPQPSPVRPAPASSPQRSARRSPTPPPITSNIAPAPAPQTAQPIATNENPRTSSLGVYRVQQSAPSVPSAKTFIPAFLEMDQKIENNSPVVFLLEADTQINGVNFRRHSIMYGQARVEGGRIQLLISRIKNSRDASMHNIALRGFDENFAMGIAAPTNNRAAQAATSDVAREVTREIGRTTTVGRVLGSGINRETNSSNRNNISVSLAQGYRIYFVTE